MDIQVAVLNNIFYKKKKKSFCNIFKLANVEVFDC